MHPDGRAAGENIHRLPRSTTPLRQPGVPGTLTDMWWWLLACRAEPEGLSRPNAVALSGDRVFVSDFHHQRIVVFNAAGDVTQTFGQRGLGRGQLWEVWGLSADPNAETEDVYVLNQRPTSSTDETVIREVKRFRDGREIERVRLVNSDGAAPPWSEGLVHRPDGGWQVAAPTQDAVLHFSAEGAWVNTLHHPESGPALKNPSRLHRENDALWIIEQFEHRIRRVNRNGRQTLQFGEEGAAPGQLRFPRALDVCPGGWLVVADFGNYRIQRFDLAGGYRDGFEPAPAHPDAPVQLLDVAVKPGCERLYLVDSKGDRVLVTTPKGVVLQELR